MTWGSGRKYTRSMRHWTKKGDALEELHRAHSISTVSYNRVNLDPLERGRQETIQRREREIVRQEDSSTGSCEEEIREINAAEFQANVEQRRRVRRRLPETPPSDHSPEASEQDSSEEYQPSPQGKAAEEEDASLIAEMIRETQWETEAQEEEEAPEESFEDVLPSGYARGTTPDLQPPSPEEEEYEDDPELGVGASPVRTGTPSASNPEGWLLEWRVVRNGKLFIQENVPSQPIWQTISGQADSFHQFGQELQASFLNKIGNEWQVNYQRMQELGIQPWDPRLSYIAQLKILTPEFSAARNAVKNRTRRRAVVDISTLPTVTEEQYRLLRSSNVEQAQVLITGVDQILQRSTREEKAEIRRLLY